MELDMCGRTIRKLMNNHNRNKTTTKVEIREELCLHPNDLPKIITMTQDYLRNLDLELVGVQTANTTDINSADKLFVRKISSDDVKKPKKEVIIEDKRMLTLFALMQVENNQLGSKKLETLQKCKYFKGVDLEDYLKKLKVQGYINSVALIDDTVYSPSWRFYVEFDNCFDDVRYFDN